MDVEDAPAHDLPSYGYPPHAVRGDIVFGNGWLTVEGPDPIRVVSSGVTIPLEPATDLATAYGAAVERPLDRPGCTVIMATRVPTGGMTSTTPRTGRCGTGSCPRPGDPYEARREFEPAFADRPDLVDRYRTGHAFHPVHAVMALYPLKRLRHAGRVLVAGADDPGVVRHAGFEPAASAEDAWTPPAASTAGA